MNQEWVREQCRNTLSRGSFGTLGYDAIHIDDPLKSWGYWQGLRDADVRDDRELLAYEYFRRAGGLCRIGRHDARCVQLP